jgi:UDP-2,4-diacetamido-2,4,6-trideoxy-beta-L-altropyranose hydrolase
MSRIVESLVIRADASAQIGAGHLMRCLALAQAWKDTGGQVAFITACQSESLLQRLKEEGFDIHLLARPYPDAGDWEYTKNILAAYPNAWVVLDGYHFDEVYQQQVKELGHQLLVIDDMAHLKHYYADIILNQNLHAEQLQYSCEPYTRLLLGTRYVLLRREFLAWKDCKREVPEVARRVLVTFGGSDPENHTLKVIQALQRVDVPGLEATVVIGADNPHADELEAAARQSRIPIQLVHDAQNMPELMAWADVAVSSAGSTVWELLFLGTPTLALILADNQCYIAEQVVELGVGQRLGWARNISDKSLAKAITLLLKDFNLRAKISKDTRQIIDGLGSQRVISIIHDEHVTRLALRQATAEDCSVVWEWANEPAVRAASFNSNPIKWDEHVDWFNTRLQNSSCLYYIVLNDMGLPIGQVRFDTKGDQAEINVSISSGFRGHGIGTKAIRTASEHLFCETQVTRINANIKLENTASVHAFAKAGYKKIGAGIVKGQEALQMVLRKNDALSKDNSYEDQ